MRAVRIAALICPLIAGCLDRKLTPIDPCLVSSVTSRIEVKGIDKLDMLFMVDNSASMTSKQRSLKAQFPRMIQVLSTGRRSPDDPSPFPPVTDMHLAVVSSDMGALGQASIPSCAADGGDDGRLQHATSGDPGCQASYPPFLSYDARRDDPLRIGQDFACIAALGVNGCDYEGQLESPFKALWPATYERADGSVVSPNPYTFLGLSADQQRGRGDRPPPDGSAGFLRRDPNNPSLLAIVLLTDEDDQSSQQTAYLRKVTDARDPLAREGVQVRPFLHPDYLYPVKRYVDGFKALRPGQESLLVFAAFAGVPTDLVDASALQKVNMADDGARGAYYERIANDPRMQQRVLSATNPLESTLAPACTRTNAQGQQEVAVPARRILEVVRGFGPRGSLQSICADDYSAGMDAIIELIARQLGAVCLPRPQVRAADGLVRCDVVWELPPANEAPSNTPTECDMLPFFRPVGAGAAAVNARGGANCRVVQLPVFGSDAPGGAGWYYDDFSPSVQGSCPAHQQQRVTFTQAAKPRNGVTVTLHCLDEVQRQPLPRQDVVQDPPQPELGSSCRAGSDLACQVQLDDGELDDSLFCHPKLNLCVRQCSSDTDCPPAWECDVRATTTADSGGRAYCVNPTCTLP